MKNTIQKCSLVSLLYSLTKTINICILIMLSAMSKSLYAQHSILNINYIIYAPDSKMKFNSEKFSNGINFTDPGLNLEFSSKVWKGIYLNTSIGYGKFSSNFGVDSKNQQTIYRSVSASYENIFLKLIVAPEFRLPTKDVDIYFNSGFGFQQDVLNRFNNGLANYNIGGSEDLDTKNVNSNQVVTWENNLGLTFRFKDIGFNIAGGYTIQTKYQNILSDELAIKTNGFNYKFGITYYLSK